MSSGYEMKQPLPDQLNQTPPYVPMGYQTGYDQGHGYQTEPDKPVYVPQQNVINGIGSGSTADSPVGPGSNGSDSRDDKRIPIDESTEAPLIPERYLDLTFENCFHEHKSTKTLPIVYKANQYIFKYTKLFFYNLFVILFGFIISFIWAMTLGILSFVLTWIWRPALTASILIISTTLPAVTEPLKALFTPLVDVTARLFRQIRVQGWLNGGLLDSLAGKKPEHVV